MMMMMWHGSTGLWPIGGLFLVCSLFEDGFTAIQII
jgi:hypothetical protein